MSYTMADFERDYLRSALEEMTPEQAQEVMQTLPPKNLQKLLQALPPENRLAGLSPENRLAGLSPEQIDEMKQHLDKLASPPRKPRRKK